MNIDKEIQETFTIEVGEMGFCLDQQWGEYENPYVNDDTALAYNLFKKGWLIPLTKIKQRVNFMATPYIVVGCPTTGGGQVISGNSMFQIEGTPNTCVGAKARLHAQNIKQLQRSSLVIHTCRSFEKLQHESMTLFHVAANYYQSKI